MLFPCVYISIFLFVQWGANVHHESSETPGGYNILLTILMPLWSPFETVFCQILHPHCHGVLRSLRKLVTRSRKYDWRGQKTLKLNINIKEYWKTKNGKLKEIIFIKFLSKYVSQFHLNQTKFFFIIRVLHYFPQIPIEEFHVVTLFCCGSLLLHLLATCVSHKFAKLRGGGCSVP